MAGKISINTERCKGCGLCAEVCPFEDIKLSTVANKLGYFPAESLDEKCSGCTICASVCPDAAIEVCRQ